MNLAKLWFWEFTEYGAYDVVVATSAQEALGEYKRWHGGQGAPAKRMPVAEVLLAGKCTPLVCDAVFMEEEPNGRDDWTCGKWLAEIEAAQKREAYEAELAARQVELFA